MRNGEQRKCPASSRAFPPGEGCRLEMRLVVPVAIVSHMFHGTAIAFLESFAEIVAGFIAFNRRVLVHLVVVGIGMATLVKVASGGFHAFMESLALGVAIAVRRAIPVTIVILRLNCSGNGPRFMCASLDCRGCRHAESKSGNCEQRYFHKIIFPPIGADFTFNA
jgi:hypothetical protein